MSSDCIRSASAARARAPATSSVCRELNALTSCADRVRVLPRKSRQTTSLERHQQRSDGAARAHSLTRYPSRGYCSGRRVGGVTDLWSYQYTAREARHVTRRTFSGGARDRRLVNRSGLLPRHMSVSRRHLRQHSLSARRQCRPPSACKRDEGFTRRGRTNLARGRSDVGPRSRATTCGRPRGETLLMLRKRVSTPVGHDRRRSASATGSERARSTTPGAQRPELLPVPLSVQKSISVGAVDGPAYLV
jgi:hypothetical protein